LPANTVAIGNSRVQRDRAGRPRLRCRGLITLTWRQLPEDASLVDAIPDGTPAARFLGVKPAAQPCALSAPKSGGAVITGQAGDGMSAMPPTPGIVLHRSK
jgi:hypothetical protein